MTHANDKSIKMAEILDAYRRSNNEIVASDSDMLDFVGRGIDAWFEAYKAENPDAALEDMLTDTFAHYVDGRDLICGREEELLALEDMYGRNNVIASLRSAIFMGNYTLAVTIETNSRLSVTGRRITPSPA